MIPPSTGSPGGGGGGGPCAKDKVEIVIKITIKKSFLQLFFIFFGVKQLRQI